MRKLKQWVRWIAFLGIISAAVLALSAQRQHKQLPKLAWTLLESEYSPPKEMSVDPGVKLPESAVVYKLRRTPVSEDRIKLLATHLGIPYKPGSAQSFTGRIDYGKTHYGLRIARDRSAGDYRAKATGEVVRVLSDGEFDYHDPRTDAMDNGEAPSAAKCKQIALNFLKKTRLVPPGAVLTAREAGGESCSGDGVAGEVWISRNIRIDIKHQGDPTDSSQSEVQIVKDGRVRYMTLQLPALEPFHTYPLKDAKGIVTALSTKQAFYNTDVPIAPISGKITSVRIYYSRNKDDLFIPMYSLKGEQTTLRFDHRPGQGRSEFWGRTAAVEQAHLLPPKPWEPAFPPGNTIVGGGK